jgi:hexulose-6-phosphate isomerase
MKRFVEEIGSEYVKVYFDVGNILIIGFPEMWIRILGKLIKRIHLKDFKLSVGNINGFCDLLEGDVNWYEVIKALKEIGYDSYLTAELGPYKCYPETKIYNTSLAMDKILGRK